MQRGHKQAKQQLMIIYLFSKRIRAFCNYYYLFGTLLAVCQPNIDEREQRVTIGYLLSKFGQVTITIYSHQVSNLTS